MARARNIKPGFFKDARVVACSFEARLMFQGLWCLADYMGRLKYIPIEIKMELFPADNIDVEARMQELRDNGLIEIYHDCSGAALVQVTNFTKHQNPHVNERVGRDKRPLPCLPGPLEVKKAEGGSDSKKLPIEQRVRDALVVLREYSESDPADSLNLIPDSLIKPPMSDSGEPDPKPKKKYKFSDDDMRAAEYLLSSLLKVIPDYKKPRSLEPWANTVRLMRERDGRTHKDICSVWSWCRMDSFENSNVLSADKLRERFDGLKSKMGAAHAANQSNNPAQRQSAVHRIDQQCADEFAQLAIEEAGYSDVAAHEPVVWSQVVEPGGGG